jgi:hypothetical protein
LGSNGTSNENIVAAEGGESLNRLLFLQSLGKWSGAAIMAVVAGSAWISSLPEANAGVRVNRRWGSRIKLDQPRRMDQSQSWQLDQQLAGQEYHPKRPGQMLRTIRLATYSFARTIEAAKLASALSPNN